MLRQIATRSVGLLSRKPQQTLSVFNRYYSAESRHTELVDQSPRTLPQDKKKAPSIKDFAIGIQREELDDPHRWEVLEDEHDGVIDRIGTFDDPIVVMTAEDSRVVGCAGACAEGVDEGLRYWVMEADTLGLCSECGQVFWCVKVDNNGNHDSYEFVERDSKAAAH